MWIAQGFIQLDQAGLMFSNQAYRTKIYISSMSWYKVVLIFVVVIVDFVVMLLSLVNPCDFYFCQAYEFLECI
jgi:hypothetical protein